MEIVPGEILVRFRAGSGAAKHSAAAHSALMLRTAGGRELSARVERLVDDADFVAGLSLTRVRPEETLPSIEALRARPDVLYAEPNYVRRADRLPNEPRFTEMWGLKNTGQPNSNGNPGQVGADVHAEAAWDITTGSRETVVGVIDEGIDINHEDLRDNIWRNPGEVSGNGLDDDGNGFVDDINGFDFFHHDATVYDGPGANPDGSPIDAHGTHVAGTIGARGDNGIGVAGVCWQASLMSLKVLGPDGGDSAALIKAYGYAKMMRDLWETTGGRRGANVRVLNNSYGGDGYSQAEHDAIRALADSDILFVAAAGNEARSNDIFPHYPSNYRAPNVLAVAASDRSDLRPNFTNAGTATVHMAAPGSSILSTLPGNAYGVFSGTSMAAPHVAGAAALVYTVSPNIPLRKLRYLLMYSGDVLHGTSYFNSLAGGRRLNVHAALQNLISGDVTPPAAVPLNLQFPSYGLRQHYVQWKAPGVENSNSGEPAAGFELRYSEADLRDSANFEAAHPFPVPLPFNCCTNPFMSQSPYIPYQHMTGFMGLRAIDKPGNVSPVTTVPATVSAENGHPYVPTVSASAPLTTGGTPLGLVADDAYKIYTLPFSFPFFNRSANYNSITVSTNGTIYLPLRTNYAGETIEDALSTTTQLPAYRMIAGLWDDLRTDRRAGDDVYVTANSERAIFRWQAVTFDTPLGPGIKRGENPVNFEIELRRDGTIQMRYGDGNTRLFPVVGLADKQPDAYLSTSHTSEFGLIDLTNAPTLTYSMRAFSPPVGATFGFAAADYRVDEGDGRAYLTVVRTGDVSGAASVDYATVDDPASVRCDVVNGTAYARCDYVTTVDTLRFAPGEARKTFSIPVIDDAFAEGTEHLTVRLSRPVNAALGAPGAATMHLDDNDQIVAANPILNSDFFVRQQYLDFLSREPEQSGYLAWLGVLANCSDVKANPACDRLSVSASFFRSQEFQLKGYFVYLFYQVSLNRRPEYAEIVTDMRAVTGQTPPEVYAKRTAFADNWNGRAEFVNLYGALSPDGYVDALMSRYGLSQITTIDPTNPDGTNSVTLSRSELKSRLAAGSLTRAQVLRALAQSREVDAVEYNGAFVAMQYYGYLRRAPEEDGYNAWLRYLTAHPDDARTMVNGFMNSAEYRLRFGTP